MTVSISGRFGYID